MIIYMIHYCMPISIIWVQKYIFKNLFTTNSGDGRTKEIDYNFKGGKSIKSEVN